MNQPTFNGPGFLPAINVSDKPIEAFAPVQLLTVDGLQIEDSGRSLLRIQPIDADGQTRVDSQRPHPIAVGFNGSQKIKAGKRGEVTFADVAVARANKFSPLLFALAGSQRLERFDTEIVNKRPVAILKRRARGVFAGVSELKTNRVVTGKEVACLVQRIPSPIYLCQALTDVDDQAAGVFRVHSISGVAGQGDITLRAGDELEVENVLLRAYNRIGGVSADEWRFVTLVDGVWSVLGGGAGRATQYAITILGDPTAGSFDLVLDFNTGATETVTIAFDDDRTEVYDKLAALTGVKDADGDVPDTLAVRGGPFPDWTMTIRIPPDGAGGGLNPDTVLEVENNTLSGGIRCRVRLATV